MIDASPLIIAIADGMQAGVVIAISLIVGYWSIRSTKLIRSERD